MKKFLLFLILLIPFFNVNALKLSSSPEYTIDLPSNCNSFYIYSKFSTRYLVCTESINAYVIEQPYYNTGLGNPTYFRTQRHVITQQQYNDWLTYNNSNTGNGWVGDNPLGTGTVAYYDSIDNKYYSFMSNADTRRYQITYNNDYSTTLSLVSSSSSYYGIIPIASNVNWYAYSNDGLNQPQSPKHAPFGIIEYNVTFHLNGGAMCPVGNLSGFDSLCAYNDFTLSFFDNSQLIQYVSENSAKKTGMVFTGWYEDINLINSYPFATPLTGSIDLYARYVFDDVNAVVDNINFIDYTFPDDKYFAVINNTSISETYIGLQLLVSNIGVYRYNFSSDIFDSYANYVVPSMGLVDNYYYYHLPLLTTIDSLGSEIKYVVLNKNQLRGLNSSGVLTDYFTFKVSDNAEVTFYSDLSNITLEDNQGNTYSGDASQIYWNTQNSITNNNDIIGVFRNLSQNRSSDILNHFVILWNKFHSTPIFVYFYILLVGSLIVFAIKVASRK